MFKYTIHSKYQWFDQLTTLVVHSALQVNPPPTLSHIYGMIYIIMTSKCIYRIFWLGYLFEKILYCIKVRPLPLKSDHYLRNQTTTSEIRQLLLKSDYSEIRPLPLKSDHYFWKKDYCLWNQTTTSEISPLPLKSDHYLWNQTTTSAIRRLPLKSYHYLWN